MMPYLEQPEQQRGAELYDSRLLWSQIFLSLRQRGIENFEPGLVRINGQPLLPADLPMETPHDSPLIDVQGVAHIPDVWGPIEREVDPVFTTHMSGFGELLAQPEDVLLSWVHETSQLMEIESQTAGFPTPEEQSPFEIRDAQTWVAGVRKRGLEQQLRLHSSQYILGDVQGKKESMLGLENSAGTVVTVTPVFARVAPESPVDAAQLSGIEDPATFQATLASMAEAGQTIARSQWRLLSQLIDAASAGAPHMRRAMRASGQAVLGLGALALLPVGFDPLLTHVAIPEHLQAQNTSVAWAAYNLNEFFQFAVRQSVTSMADARIAEAITSQGGDNYDAWLQHEQQEHVRLLQEIHAKLALYKDNFFRTLEASVHANLPTYVTPFQGALVDASVNDFFTGIENIESMWG